MIQYIQIALADRNAEKKIGEFLQKWGDSIPKDNLTFTDAYFTAFWDDADDTEKQRKAVLHQFKRDVLMYAVKHEQQRRDLLFITRRVEKGGKGTKPEDILDAKDNLLTLEAHIDYCNEKIKELENAPKENHN